MPSSHDFVKDKRNKKIKIFINNKFYSRDKAKVSVFDSSVILGDGIWSGIRFHNNKFLFLKDHLDRLFDDAKKISLKIHLSKKQISKILHDTVNINKMKTGWTVPLMYWLGTMKELNDWAMSYMLKEDCLRSQISMKNWDNKKTRVVSWMMRSWAQIYDIQS